MLLEYDIQEYVILESYSYIHIVSESSSEKTEKTNTTHFKCIILEYVILGYDIVEYMVLEAYDCDNIVKG